MSTFEEWAFEIRILPTKQVPLENPKGWRHDVSGSGSYRLL